MNQKTKEPRSTKATRLQELNSIGVNIPNFKVFHAEDSNTDTFHLVFKRWLEDNISSAYDGKFSVRSSGSVSTPGLMQTILEVENDVHKLLEAGLLVHKSSKLSRVRSYLDLKGVTDFKLDVIVQAMVYGNSNPFDCSGVLVTTHPINGGDEIYGELVFNSLGDSLMSGRANPSRLSALATENPKGYSNLMIQVERIKNHYRTPQEIEFVIEDGNAWILQARDYKGIIGLNVNFPLENLIARGMAATPISAVGKITYFLDAVNEDSIYVSDHTDWDETEKIIKGKGIITLTGGSLSHAAIIAREFDLPCITGVQEVDQEVLPEGMTVGMDNHGGIYKIE